VGSLVAAGAALAGAIFVVIVLPPRPTESLDSELTELLQADHFGSPEML
jgi:hypothetical protein